eukprot:PhM_4_TR12316/c0_g1_i2/m.697
MFRTPRSTCTALLCWSSSSSTSSSSTYASTATAPSTSSSSQQAAAPTSSHNYYAHLSSTYVPRRTRGTNSSGKTAAALCMARQHVPSTRDELKEQASASGHEVKLLAMGHGELTNRLRTLYYRIHTAAVLIDKIALSSDKRVYTLDRKIKKIKKELKAVRKARADVEALYMRHVEVMRSAGTVLPSLNELGNNNNNNNDSSPSTCCSTLIEETTISEHHQEEEGDEHRASLLDERTRPQ